MRIWLRIWQGQSGGWFYEFSLHKSVGPFDSMLLAAEAANEQMKKEAEMSMEMAKQIIADKAAKHTADEYREAVRIFKDRTRTKGYGDSIYYRSFVQLGEIKEILVRDSRQSHPALFIGD